MSNKKDRVNQLIEWAKIKNVEVTEHDIKIFEDIIGLAKNDGYKEAIKETKKIM